MKLNVIITLYLLVYLCDCKRKRIGQILSETDNVITDILEHPENKNGDVVFKDLIFYCRKLIQLTKMVEERNERALMPAKALYKQGGPKFLDVEIDYDVLQKGLDWDEEDVLNMNYVYDKAYAAWIEFSAAYKRNIVWFL
uniref:Prolyl 4-hydroxylase alpha-subunit N-terminal domain-containing protein n=1 Tax=Clastoptera arizonana TaxID=38151 RepID=A0A1B6ECA6_9HEMI